VRGPGWGNQINPERVLREMGEVVTLGMYKPLGQATLTSQE